MDLPHDLLPAPEPRLTKHPPDFFYRKVAKPLITDVVRIMDNGLHIDLEKVTKLEEVLVDQLNKVTETLSNNTHISKFLDLQHEELINKAKAEAKSKMKPITHFIKPFNPSDMVHRSYFMHIYASRAGITEPTTLLPTGIPKWSAATVKKLASSNPLLKKLLNKEIPPTNTIATQAMELLAKHKQELYNTKYLDKINNPSVPAPEFNPGSSKQKQQLFAMLDVSSEKFSKRTGEPSYDKDELFRINNETTDPLVEELTGALLEDSAAAIIKNNFIKAFYDYTVDSRLYGTLKLFGAKSLIIR